jgi:hypothetical protein
MPEEAHGTGIFWKSPRGNPTIRRIIDASHADARVLFTIDPRSRRRSSGASVIACSEFTQLAPRPINVKNFHSQ